MQEEARRQASQESDAKIENAQLKSEFVAASDKIQQLQREIQRVESEKRDGVGRIEAMQVNFNSFSKSYGANYLKSAIPSMQRLLNRFRYRL